jgi:hypothetical protein
MRDLQRWSGLVSLLGGVTLVVGSFDPMEGSVLILWSASLRSLRVRRGFSAACNPTIVEPDKELRLSPEPSPPRVRDATSGSSRWPSSQQ